MLRKIVALVEWVLWLPTRIELRFKSRSDDPTLWL